MADHEEEDGSYRFSSAAMRKKKPRQLRIKKTPLADDDEDEDAASKAIPPPSRPTHQRPQQQSSPSPQQSPRKSKAAPFNFSQTSLSPTLVASDGSSPLVRPLAVRDDRHHRLLLGTHRRRTRHGFRRLENLLAVLQKVESNLLRQPISRESVDLPLPKRRIP
jgi:hypothetical protein